MVAAAVPLYDFQRRWLADNSRFKIGCICRQAGKSFMVALEVVLDAAATGQLWVLLSRGERQSRELMEKVKMHLEAMGVAASAIEEDFFEGSEVRQLTVRLANGGRIIALPANPDTARGYTGNVVLDEFAIHKDSEAIWKALFPTVSRGFKLRVVSTPMGMSNRFYRLWTSDNGFSRHFVDINQAVADGVPHNIEQLKEAIDDDDAWQQEYLCLFIDEAAAWLSYELIASCQDEKVPYEVSYENFNLDAFCAGFNKQGRLFLGQDVGRKKDLTVINIDEQLGDVYYNRLMIVCAKVTFTQQEDLVKALYLRLNIERGCIDATGIGAMLAERLQEALGTARVEPVTFTAQVKNDLATRGKRLMEDRLVRIDASRNTREDMHSLKKTTTAAGNVRFDADRSDLGHADRAWAKFLTWMASDSGAEKCELIALG